MITGRNRRRNVRLDPARATAARYRDDVADEATFWTTILVVCPRCAREARVETRSDAVRMTCAHCGKSLGATGPEAARGKGAFVARGTCRRCLAITVDERRMSARPGANLRPELRCKDCGSALKAQKCWFRLDPTTAPRDPWFGLPFFLQMRVGRHILWATNTRHLAFLSRYISATLRERDPYRNGSPASRLPAWMSDAKKRDAMLAAIARLRSMLAG